MSLKQTKWNSREDGNLVNRSNHWLDISHHVKCKVLL